MTVLVVSVYLLPLSHPWKSCCWALSLWWLDHWNHSWIFPFAYWTVVERKFLFMTTSIVLDKTTREADICRWRWLQCLLAKDCLLSVMHLRTLSKSNVCKFIWTLLPGKWPPIFSWYCNVCFEELMQSCEPTMWLYFALASKLLVNILSSPCVLAGTLVESALKIPWMWAAK